MLLDFPKPECFILDKCVSWSGKYFGFLGSHYEAGKLCYVVGASNKTNGEIITRHYNEEKCVNIEAAKFAATQYWEQTLKPGLLKAPTGSEDADRSAVLESWFERYDDEVRKRSDTRRKPQ